MICPIVEQAHFGTTRYTMLSLSVIQVPGKPICPYLLGFAARAGGRPRVIPGKNQIIRVYSIGHHHYLVKGTALK
ncbi:MAG: hypothetical protein AB7S99_05330, partial [Pseudodonghicola sp.]